jgi:hypothetical protein
VGDKQSRRRSVNELFSFSSSSPSTEPTLYLFSLVGSTFSFSVLVKEDPSLPVPEPISFPEQKALILCDDSFSRRNLIVNLRYLNVRLVTTFNALDEALSPEFEHSLISTQYDILLLNPDYVPNDKVKHISKIQPSARIFYLVKAKDLGAKVSQMNLPASAFLPRPIKRSNLYDIVRPRPKGQSNGKKKDMVKTVSSQGIDSTLGSTAPLRILIVDDNKVRVTIDPLSPSFACFPFYWCAIS